MNKKGELTSQQLVIIIVLIVSFAVILGFFYLLNLKSEITNEGCRNSVVLKGTTFGANVQLQCKTQNTCVSSGGECNVPNEDKISVKSEEELYGELSDLMYSCWWQMGEGKIDYAGSSALSSNYCVICNRIYFDSATQEKFKQVPMENLYKYMQRNKVPKGDVSYLTYLYGVSDVDALRSTLMANGGPDIYSSNIDLSSKEGFALVTSEVKQGYINPVSITATLLSVGAGVLLTPKAGWAVATGFEKAVKGINYIKGVLSYGVAGAAAQKVYGFFVGDSSGNLYQPPVIYPYNEESIKGLNCKAFSSLS
jgi:hypothetical protein